MILKADGFWQVYYSDKDFREPENVTVKCLIKTPRAELTIVNHVMSKHTLWDEELKNVICNRWRIIILKSLSKIISFNTLYAIIYHVLLVYHIWWVWWLSTVRLLLNNEPSQILKSIVIVDDEEDLCNLFTEVLQNNGYNVLGFLDPIQARTYSS